MADVVVAPLQDPVPEWPPVTPLDAPELPRLNPEWLPGFAGEFVRALSASTETPPELPAALVLAVCSAAAARRLRVRVGPDYFEPTNLWFVAALNPGNRKSAVQSAATAPLLAWERDQAAVIGPEITQAQSLRETMKTRAGELRKKAAKLDDPSAREDLTQQVAQIEAGMPEVPVVPQLWTSDATPERLGSILADHGERMAWMSSEGGVFDLLAGRYSGGVPNLDLVLKAHSGDSERVDRGNRPPVYLHHPLLTVGLSPQPSVLRGLATKPGFRGRGLLGRFLYLLPPDPLGFRQLEDVAMPEGTRTAYDAGVRAMLDWPPAEDERPHVVRMSPEATTAWKEYQRAMEAMMRPGGDAEHATDWAAKAPGAAARLAGVLHAVEHAHSRPWESAISGETMEAALELMTALTRHSLEAMNLMGADPTIDGARRVWRWIEAGRHERFKLRDAHAALKGRFSRVKDLREAVDVLEERGYVREVETEPDGPGRPSTWLEVNPAVTGAWS
ncbi:MULTISPECIES: YfjI family protein [unclassified Thioalkalivibrio]|uniref:YfjI family protein n=1 Tax=unclassified Thioalkalivibrio TaxID=2621013 RepID=UPI0003AA7F84|nr:MULTISPECIES: YfjI family protein [unclassified Thioalkalivibrio]